MTLQMPAEPRFPMPGNHFPGNRRVIASCYYRELTKDDQQYKQPDDDWPDTVYLVMLLNPQPPYYTVAHIDPISWRILVSTDHPNINPATEDYFQSGGDY